jgi:uncharacterized sulfatase
MKLPVEPADDLSDIPKPALTRGAPNMTDEQRKKAIAAYYACVSMVDAQVGKLMAQMDALKLWDNTIVIFTSDHGWHLDEHGLWGKVTLFEEAAKVPLIIVAPDPSRRASSAPAAPTSAPAASATARAGAGVCPVPVELIDLYPTLCDLAGVAVPAHAKLDGISLEPQLQNPAAGRSNNQPAFSILRRGKIFGRAVYTERYRYTEWGDDGRRGIELYDHAADPKEYTNLAREQAQADTIAKLKSLLDAQIHVRDTDPPSAGSGD